MNRPLDLPSANGQRSAPVADGELHAVDMLLGRHSIGGSRDLPALAVELLFAAPAVRMGVEARLSPVEQGQLAVLIRPLDAAATQAQVTVPTQPGADPAMLATTATPATTAQPHLAVSLAPAPSSPSALNAPPTTPQAEAAALLTSPSAAAPQTAGAVFPTASVQAASFLPPGVAANAAVTASATAQSPAAVQPAPSAVQAALAPRFAAASAFGGPAGNLPGLERAPERNGREAMPPGAGGGNARGSGPAAGPGLAVQPALTMATRMTGSAITITQSVAPEAFTRVSAGAGQESVSGLASRLTALAEPAMAGLTRRAALAGGEASPALASALARPGALAAAQQGFADGVRAEARALAAVAAERGGPVASGLGTHPSGVRPATSPQYGLGTALSALAPRGSVPPLVGRELAQALGSMWSRLRSAHAEAAATGPQAEARWIGQTAGRLALLSAAGVAPGQPPLLSLAGLERSAVAAVLLGGAALAGDATAGAPAAGGDGGSVELGGAGGVDRVVRTNDPPGPALAPSVQQIRSDEREDGGAPETIDTPQLEGWDAAEGIYEDIRANSHDVVRIAALTGWPLFRIARIKAHIFFDHHRLDRGRARFDAHPAIASAWLRLTEGQFARGDLRLLAHALFQARFEGIFHADHRAAHDAAIRAGWGWGR